jgi:cysteine desulfurase
VLYLDHAATTPLTPAARAAWLEAAALIGNPHSLHGPGRAVRAVVEEARERIAAALGADPAEVVLTAGGTEADNLAVLGAARARRAADPALTSVFVSAVEHHAVLEPARSLRREGFDVAELPVTGDGCVDLGQAEALIVPGRTALVSTMTVNNETGAVQPVAELAGLAHAAGAPFHTDAVQAVAYLPPPVTADAVTLSAHKLGGPVGVGALVARRDLALTPVTFGGGQERRVRSGTLPAALVAAFAAALDEAVAARADEAARLRGLSARLIAGLARLPGVSVTGPADPARRAPHIVHALVDGCLGEDLLLLLDRAGIAASTGSACTAGVAQPSHVLQAMGHADAAARSGLRFSFGRDTCQGDVDTLLGALAAALAQVRGEAPWPA